MRDLQQRRQRLVQQWLSSGLSAEQFGAQHGLQGPTLRCWKFRLSQLSTKSSPPPSPLRKQHQSTSAPDTVLTDLPWVELRSTATTAPRDCFELELTNGRRLRVPASFESDSLRKL